MDLKWRTRIFLLAVLLIAYQFMSVKVGSTLTVLAFDGSQWSVPPEVQMAVFDLREKGHEIRVVDVDVLNGNDGRVAEFGDCLESARQYGLPALTFRTGFRVASNPVPLKYQEFTEAVE